MHGECYRRGNGQPYTRKQYIKGKPQIKITKFQSGSADRLQNYDNSVQLLINEKLQITHMAIESTRLAANKTLEKTTGESGYFSKLFKNFRNKLGFHRTSKSNPIKNSR